ncbi:GNAT family N-acetyltransferase [Ktedonosporobacter rubrisoli]|uniref:GNAT family N-acetyltransferase n=1 Tax=Ktedonosporobacter rubrisoli TaxID=2509675 RepID=A0A4V0YZS2_KTERU|nr:GNAT family N-acetyltransferase [Ktedonosporobacter rubrisoli]QBD80711.1 GNAT family N-acetyltransferase [Ktedonosporobacter rubrisoli]
MVTLQPMTDAEFQHFIEPVIVEYAQGHVEDGQWAEEEALEKARKDTYSLLPAGVATPNHYLFTIVNEAQQKVGILWFATQDGHGKDTAFVYDVRIDETFRRQGYASQAFREMEHKVRELGYTRISLHVFGKNHAALQMYQKLGYEMSNVMMAKTLDPG